MQIDHMAGVARYIEKNASRLVCTLGVGNRCVDYPVTGFYQMEVGPGLRDLLETPK